MRIIGVDPGLTKTGIGIIEVKNNSFSYVFSDTIRTNSKDFLAQRLFDLHKRISEIIDIYKPDQAAIEETFLNNNPVSSLKLGHARGALMLSLALKGLEVSEYSSTAVKKAVVGVGRADKNQVGTMIKILLPGSKCKSEDEADALAIAISHNNLKRRF